MDAFSYILQKHLGVMNPIKMSNGGSWEFWGDYYAVMRCKDFVNIEYQTIQYYIFSFISSVYYQINNEAQLQTVAVAKYKLEQLNWCIENPFLSAEMKELIIDVYSKTQKTYNAFTKLSKLFIYKKNKPKAYKDLCMNELDENSRNVIQIMQHKTKYLFLISDLMGIFRTALLNSSYFFPEPILPKNPYNNVDFDISTIYNIYFHMEHNRLIIPMVFRLFYNSNLDLDLFLHNNESFIRDAIVYNHAFTTPTSYLFKDLVKMMTLYKAITSKLDICIEFPRDKLVEIFRPYLHLYFIRKYSVSGTDKYNSASNKLKSKLRSFVKFNHCFGRKTVKLIRKSIFYFTPTKQPKFLKESYINMKYPSYHTGNMDVNSILEYRIPADVVCDTNRRMFVDLQLDSPRPRGHSIRDSLITNIMENAILQLNNDPLNEILSISDDSSSIYSDSDNDSDNDINNDINNIIDRHIDDINHHSDNDSDSDDSEDDGSIS